MFIPFRSAAPKSDAAGRGGVAGRRGGAAARGAGGKRDCDLALVGRIAALDEAGQRLEIAISRRRVGIDRVAELQRARRLLPLPYVIGPDFLDRRLLCHVGEAQAPALAPGEAVDAAHHALRPARDAAPGAAVLGPGEIAIS